MLVVAITQTVNLQHCYYQSFSKIQKKGNGGVGGGNNWIISNHQIMIRLVTDVNNTEVKSEEDLKKKPREGEKKETYKRKFGKCIIVLANVLQNLQVHWERQSQTPVCCY